MNGMMFGGITVLPTIGTTGYHKANSKAMEMVNVGGNDNGSRIFTIITCPPVTTGL